MVARAKRAGEPSTGGSLDDPQVLERVLAGDTGLFEIIVRRYNQRLFRVARGIVGDDGEAEDVVQEAYVRAYRSLGSFRGEAPFSTWLTRIAVYEAMARAKKQRRLMAVADQEPQADGRRADGDPESRLGNRELGRVLTRAVDELPTPLRSVFVLREVEGLSTEETADLLGITSPNVRVRLHRAKAALRDRLDDVLGREARRLYAFAGERCDRIVERVCARISELD